MRGSALHASIASAVNHTVRLPRARRPASYAAQLMTRCFCFGVWWRRAAFALNGTRGAPAWWRGLAPASPYPKAPRWAIDATRRLEADFRREENRLEQARTRGCPELVQRSLLASITALEAQAGDLRRGIAAHVAADAALQADLERLMTIPAVGPKTATRMPLMLRSHAFDTARQAAAFLGLVPVERTSGTSVRGRPTLSRAGNPRLRAALYMAAVVGIRKNPDLRAQYGRLLARGKCKMAALGAAMRKLVHLCFGVLKSEGGYRPAAAIKA